MKTAVDERLVECFMSLIDLETMRNLKTNTKMQMNALGKYFLICKDIFNIYKYEGKIRYDQETEFLKIEKYANIVFGLIMKGLANNTIYNTKPKKSHKRIVKRKRKKC